MLESLTNVLSDVNVTNGNAITGYHYNGMKVKDTFSSKANRVYNVTLVKDEVVSKESFEERGTMLDASQIAKQKAAINPLTLPTVEPSQQVVVKKVIFLRWLIIKLSAPWLIRTLKNCYLSATKQPSSNVEF